MQLLTEFFAATTTTTGGVRSSGLDLTAVIGIPAALVALVALVAYAVGTIRPLLIKQPRYWREEATTRFSCVVRNRSFLTDRTITGLTLVEAPGWLKRTFWPFWTRKPQRDKLLIWDVPKMPLVGKRDEMIFNGELRESGLPGAYDPGSHSRLLAHAGSRASRSKRVKKVDDGRLMTF